MTDLTTDEQANVRIALRLLRLRCGGWKALAKGLGLKHNTISHVAGGKTVSARMAVRVARLAAVSVDDVLTGKYPPAGTCPHCGHRTDAADAAR